MRPRGCDRRRGRGDRVALGCRRRVANEEGAVAKRTNGTLLIELSAGKQGNNQTLVLEAIRTKFAARVTGSNWQRVCTASPEPGRHPQGEPVFRRGNM